MHKHPQDFDDLNDVFAILWRRLPWIVVSSLVGAMLALVIAYSSKQLFQSDAVFVPVADYGHQLGGSSLGGMGGIASLAGIDFGSKDAKQVKRIEYLTSRTFLLPFITEQNLKPLIFAEVWDATEQQWLPPVWYKRLYAWLRGREVVNEPSLLTAYEVFLRDHIRIDEDSETGFLNVLVWLEDAELAQATLTALINRANEELRNAERAQVERRIAYLEHEAEQARLTEIKAALYGLLEAEYKQLMVANIAEHYAFEVLDAPHLPERLAKPSKVLYALGGGFAGVALAIAGLLLFSRPISKT